MKIFLLGAMVCAIGMMTACKSGTAKESVNDTIVPTHDELCVSTKVTTALPKIIKHNDENVSDECFFRDDLEGIATQVAFVEPVFDFDPDTLPDDDERIELYDDFATYANEGAQYLIDHGIEFARVKPNTIFKADGTTYKLPDGTDGAFVFYLTNSASNFRQLFVYGGLWVGYEAKIDDNGEWHFAYNDLQVPLIESTKDTAPGELNDGSASKAMDISLPLYTFKSKEVHDIIEQIVDKWKDDYGALEITYLQTVDTIIANYGEEIIPYGYNMIVNSVHYDYHGNAYEDIADKVAGCCMIGKKFCYIKNRLTRDHLFRKNTGKKSHTVYSYNTVCPCAEYEDYFLLGGNDNIVHLSFDYKKLHSMTFQ